MYSYRQLDDPLQVIPIAQSAYAFRQPEQGSVDEWLATSIRHKRELYGIYEDDRLLSAFMLYEFQMRLRNSVIPMGGIGMLCSRLDARGKGTVRCMLGNALRTMKEKGHVVSVLDPFDESFYRNYGWGKFSRRQIIELQPGMFCIPDDLDSGFVAIDLPFPDDESMAFYNDYAAKHYTLAQRGQREWERRMKIFAWSVDVATRGVVRFSKANQVVGLMEYELTRKPEEYKSTFTVTLLAYEDAAVLREMLRYPKRLSHQISKVRLSLPLDIDLWPHLSDRPNQWTIRDEFMIRIVSMDALDGLSINAPDLSLGIDVDDQQAPWNQGIWELSIDSRILRVKRGKHADLRCGIGALSSVISGFSTIEAMISSRRAEALATYQGQDYPKAVPFLADHF